MKKRIIITLALLVMLIGGFAQTGTTQLTAATTQLEKARTAKDYEQLVATFEKISSSDKTWLPAYYAAFCSARIGWLYQEDGERIEPYADKAETLINTALSAIDTSTQKKELAEIFVVMNMVNQARVFINPMTYGPKYGPVAHSYLQRAKKLEPQNPRVIYLEGWMKFSAPKMYGGDKAKAKELFNAALQQLATEHATNNYPHWGKTEVEEMLRRYK